MASKSAKRLYEDAHVLQDAGCFGIVLESVPSRLAQAISQSLEIPTIGIGAGTGCDGQVLVVHDMLGLFERFTPKFVKRYAELFSAMQEAITAYRLEVESRAFPAPQNTVEMSDEEWETLQNDLGL
jgi:3-methyl-2-oxobutanoate hydroxymethyltransferase